jgi:hypothetical protein
MSQTLELVRELVKRKSFRISKHGYNELSNDGLIVGDIVAGIDAAVVIEDYPNYPRGRCVLVMQQYDSRSPVHVVWGIPSGKAEPAVLVTAYRPDPAKWEPGFLRRRT